MIIQSNVPFPPSQSYGTGNNQLNISGWPPYTTPFEIHNSQYGYVSSDGHESYPGTYASSEMSSHGYATNHNYGTDTQNYNLHSHSPSTHQVHGGHQNRHGGYQGYGHQVISGHKSQKDGHQGNGHQVHSDRQGYRHQVHSGQQNQYGGHQGHSGQQGFSNTGLCHPKDHKNNRFGHDNNSTVYSAMKGIDD